MDTITLLPLLSQSLSSDPQTRRNSERLLASNESVPGFLLSVLSIVQGAGEAPMEIRLAAGIYFKNAVRKMWGEVSLNLPDASFFESRSPGWQGFSSPPCLHIRVKQHLVSN